MLEHQDDFQPYMEDDENFGAYCKRMSKVSNMSNMSNTDGHDDLQHSARVLEASGLCCVNHTCLQRPLASHPAPNQSDRVQSGGEVELSPMVLWQSCCTSSVLVDALDWTAQQGAACSAEVDAAHPQTPAEVHACPTCRSTMHEHRVGAVQDGAWAGQQEQVAAARHFHVRIAIYQAGQACWIIQTPDSPQVLRSITPTAVLTLPQCWHARVRWSVASQTSPRGGGCPGASWQGGSACAGTQAHAAILCGVQGVC